MENERDQAVVEQKKETNIPFDILDKVDDNELSVKELYDKLVFLDELDEDAGTLVLACEDANEILLHKYKEYIECIIREVEKLPVEDQDKIHKFEKLKVEDQDKLIKDLFSKCISPDANDGLLCSLLEHYLPRLLKIYCLVLQSPPLLILSWIQIFQHCSIVFACSLFLG